MSDKHEVITIKLYHKIIASVITLATIISSPLLIVYTNNHSGQDTALLASAIAMPICFASCIYTARLWNTKKKT